MDLQSFFLIKNEKKQLALLTVTVLGILCVQLVVVIYSPVPELPSTVCELGIEVDMHFSAVFCSL